MGKLLDELLDYLSNASSEQLEKDWKQLEPFSHVGPTAEEFVKLSLGLFSRSSNQVKEVNIINTKENPEYALDFSF